MAVHFVTSNPTALLEAFKAAVDNNEVRTWEYDDDGDYYHTDSQFEGLAWFHPQIEQRRLSFYMIKSKGGYVNQFVYAYYHGHLIETFLAHFDKMFGSGSATALAAWEDDV